MRTLIKSILCLLLAAAFGRSVVVAATTAPAWALQEQSSEQKAAPAQADKPKGAAAKSKPDAKGAKTPAPKIAEDEEALKAELDAIKDLPVAERVERLQAFIAAHPQSASRVRASELLTGARAALGDEKLRAGDVDGGVELFKQIVADVTPDTSDRLFAEVVSKLPANLYLLGRHEAGIALARDVERKAAGNAKRLLGVAAFYLMIERADEAARVAGDAARLAPDNASAHQALGAAHRMALQLDKAADEYARALKLEPASATSRRSLADLRRATGKAEEALALYREQSAADPKDAGARAGVVLSLFDAGRRDEAEAELQKALEEQPGNLQLLVGASNFFAAQGDGARALTYAERAVRLEPQASWVWARLAFARALLAGKRPLDAERAVRLALELGRFPTLDYELATALAAAGLYEEAAEGLSKTFALGRDGQLETYLAGRTLARAADFGELLAPERRASTFQHKAADTPENARMLKALLAFHLATIRKAGVGALGAEEEKRAVEAALEFVAGEDEMRTFRQLYVAGKLIERGAALQVAFERTDEAMGGVEPALDSPAIVVALLAEELRDARAQARAARAQMSVPAVPRNTLSNILRGRIEDLAGWALYHQGKHTDAVVRLRRAVSVLPENSYWWRAAEWHLGAALDAGGNGREALAAYVRAYRLAPDPARRAVIESLYRRINGTDNGLDRLLGAPAQVASNARGTQPAAMPRQNADAARTASVAAASAVKDDTSKQAATSTTTTESAAPSPASSETTTPANPSPAPLPTPTPTTTAATSQEPEQKPAPAEAREQQAAPVEKQPDATVPTERTAAPVEAGASRQSKGEGSCALSSSETALSVKSGGGAAVLTVTVEGAGDPSKINAVTSNWADILVFAEPRTAADANAQRYTISSASGKPGTYAVTFGSPCGKLDVQVEVK